MKELLHILEKNNVRHVVIGGYSIQAWGLPRMTLDIDIYIPPKDTENLDRLNQALDHVLDMKIDPMGPHGENFVQTFQTPWGMVQFHLGGASLPPFDEAEARSVRKELEPGFSIRCLSGSDLLKSKLVANRPKDQQDIEFLRELEKLGQL